MATVGYGSAAPRWRDFEPLLAERRRAGRRFAYGVRATASRVRALVRRAVAPRRLTDVAAHFDSAFYLARYPDIGRVGCDPLRHFQDHGWREGRDPSAWLSTAAYLRRHPELLVTGEDPLTHLARLSRASRHRADPAPARPPDGTPSLLAAVIEAQPQFPIKWRVGDYLAKGLSDMERARSQLHSFAVLEAMVPQARSLLFRGVPLWRELTVAGPVEIRFALASAPGEGELALSLTLFGQPLAILSFNIFPGAPLHPTERDRLFISRMQTEGRSGAAARLVSRALGDVTLQACLFAAAQGVAQAFGIAEFLGVPAARQASLHPDRIERATAAYDVFYESLGASLTPDGLYLGSTAIEARPMSMVKAGHKIRTRRKRALKQAICASAKAALEGCSAAAQPTFARAA